MEGTRRLLTISIIITVAIFIVQPTWEFPVHPTQIALLQCLQNHTDPSDSKNISSILFSTSNPSYPSLLQAYIRNLRFNSSKTPKPHFIITPTKKTHVSSAVFCTQILGLQIRIRSGGHDYEGLSYSTSSKSDPFVVLDLFNLNSVNVDIGNQSAYVMAGATLGEIYYGIWGKTRVHGFPAGSSPTVGAGGHISGGGFGNMIRRFGLSVDHMIDAEIVNANGEILDRASMGEDLFWAIRGGGGASFGVLLSYTLNLVSVPKTVTVSKIVRFLDDNATDLVYKWQFMMKDADDDLFIRVLLHPVTVKGKNVKTIRVKFMFLFLGSKDRLISAMRSDFPELGLQDSDCKEMSWIESVMVWANYPVGTSVEALLDRTRKSKYVKKKSDYVQDPIPKQGLEQLWKKLIELGKPGLVLNPYGGMMSRVSESETAFPHRAGNLYMVLYSVAWRRGGEEEEAKHLRMIRELYDFMAPYVSKSPRSAFLNYRDLDIGVSLKGDYDEGRIYGERYFKGNFDRLVRVKTRVDPNDFFKNEQSIPVLKLKDDESRFSLGFVRCFAVLFKEWYSNVVSLPLGW